MASRKGQHKSDKEQYNAYATLLKRSKNRKARLARHLKAHPEDTQAKTALGTDGKQKANAHVKGNYPEQKFYLYDGAGRKTEVISVEPATKASKK
jgi:hypothetical protein